MARQVPLVPGIPVVIVIHNTDDVRHDFGSSVFQTSSTQIEADGVVSYGRGLQEVFLDGGRGASIRFMAEHTGRYEFKCAIHRTMRGELLLFNIGTA